MKRKKKKKRGPQKKLVAMIATLHKDQDAASIRWGIKVLHAACHEYQRPGYIAVAGWDDDPRPLIEIPEARQLARTAIQLGLLPLLASNNAGLNGILAPEDMPLGGAEFWCLAHAQLDDKGEVICGQPEQERMLRDLEASKDALFTLLAPPVLPMDLERLEPAASSDKDRGPGLFDKQA